MVHNKPNLKGYFEEYGCGCTSETVKRKRDLQGYCSQHGEDRKQIHPDIDFQTRRDQPEQKARRADDRNPNQQTQTRG